jgi:hypothetical protein
MSHFREFPPRRLERHNIELPARRTNMTRIVSLLLDRLSDQSEETPYEYVESLPIESADRDSTDDMTGVAELLETASLTTGNLTARRIRIAAARMLDPETEDTVDLKPDQIRDVMSQDGEIGISLTDSYRRVYGITKPNISIDPADPRFVIWTDSEEEPGFLRKRLDLDEEDLLDQPIKFGLATTSILDPGQAVFVPILMNTRTAEGCSFVLPNGSELDPEHFNLPKVTGYLVEISELLESIRSGIQLQAATETIALLAEKTSQLIETLGRRNQNSDALALNVLHVDMLDDERFSQARMEIEDNIGELSVKKEQHKIVDIVDHQGMPKSLRVIKTTSKQREVFNGEKQIWRFLVAEDGDNSDPRTDVRYRQWTIWYGPDRHEYGNDVPQFPRYRVRIDELDRLQLWAFDDTLEGLEPASKKEEGIIADILTDRLKRSR